MRVVKFCDGFNKPLVTFFLTRHNLDIMSCDSSQRVKKKEKER